MLNRRRHSNHGQSKYQYGVHTDIHYSRTASVLHTKYSVLRPLSSPSCLPEQGLTSTACLLACSIKPNLSLPPSSQPPDRSPTVGQQPIANSQGESDSLVTARCPLLAHASALMMDSQSSGISSLHAAASRDAACRSPVVTQFIPSVCSSATRPSAAKNEKRTMAHCIHRIRTNGKRSLLYSVSYPIISLTLHRALFLPSSTS